MKRPISSNENHVVILVNIFKYISNKKFPGTVDGISSNIRGELIPTPYKQFYTGKKQ